MLSQNRPSWQEQLARKARASTETSPTITLFGVPEDFAALLGFLVA